MFNNNNKVCVCVYAMYRWSMIIWLAPCGNDTSRAPGTSLLWLPARRGLRREALGRGKAQRETSPWPEHQGSQGVTNWSDLGKELGITVNLVWVAEQPELRWLLVWVGWAAWVDVAVYVFWNRVRGGTSNQPGIRKQISVWVEVRDHTWTQRWG